MIAEIKFTQDDTADEIELKHKIIKQYNARIAVRREKKDYVINNKLYDYKAAAEADSSRETEFERDLIARLRPLKKLREPKKHNAFVDLLIRKHQTER
jgi:transcriptional adapter 2-alpha